MPAYLVRIIDTHDIVGFFYADKMDELLVAIDECTEPVDCEYIELPPGGIYWGSPAVAVPLQFKDETGASEPEKELPWDRVDLSERWFDAVYGYLDSEWTAFFPNAPRSPAPNPPRRRSGPGKVIPIRPRRNR
jgi:hypothetical protein